MFQFRRMHAYVLSHAVVVGVPYEHVRPRVFAKNLREVVVILVAARVESVTSYTTKLVFVSGSYCQYVAICQTFRFLSYAIDFRAIGHWRCSVYGKFPQNYTLPCHAC